MERFMIHEAIAAVWTIVDELNGYLTEQEPWALAKNETKRERLEAVLYTAADGLRALAVLLSPVIPQASAKLWRALGMEPAVGSVESQSLVDAGTPGGLPGGTTVGELEPLFPRIENDS
jgi:methionyl-tRNA synthetase